MTMFVGKDKFKNFLKLTKSLFLFSFIFQITNLLIVKSFDLIVSKLVIFLNSIFIYRGNPLDCLYF